MKTPQIDRILDALHDECNLRELRQLPAGMVNLASNDYLGLGADGLELQMAFLEELAGSGKFVMSNPASRLMSGNIPEYESLEAALAKLFREERNALVLNSGYTANTGAIPALTEKGDLLLADKLCHASIVDGLRLSSADFIRFRHNDPDHIEELIRKHRDSYRDIWVVTESIFSMDGDPAPLREIVALKERYDLQLFLDEAHSLGVRGPNGAGLAAELGLSEQVDVIVAGLGKALCSSGGVILSTGSIKKLLINRMRTLIFSTALPAVNLLWSRRIVELLPSLESRREHLRMLVKQFPGAQSQIIPLIVGDSARTLRIAENLRDSGFFVSAVRPPTVPRGTERIRISLNAGLTMEQIEAFKTAWQCVS